MSLCFWKHKLSRCAPYMHTNTHTHTHTHTQTHTRLLGLEKASETKGAAHSSMEFTEDRMLASWSRNAALIPAYTPYSHYTLYHHVSV